MIKVIQEMPELTGKLARVFTDISCTAFKPTPYVITKTTDGGLLVFSTLTCALLFAKDIFSLTELFEKVKNDDDLRKQLLLYRVIIPASCNEQQFCEKLRSLLMGEKKRRLRGKMNGFIIFTTTACNARCYYCFEHGYAPVTMTEETAQKTAEYIEAHADGEVTITWFGGEPLINTQAIDIITEYLAAHNVPFKSRMVTNAYLFTPELIKTARDKWCLINAQITLDGTRENYNRIKSYANSDSDAFDRVIGNIKALADNEITVILYFTLSRENESNLYVLFEELTPMIEAYPDRFFVFPSLLQQYCGAPDEDELQQKLFGMQAWLRENGLMGEPELPQSLLLNSCTADNPGMTVIQADGRLNCCDHIDERSPYGSIFGTAIDQSIVDWWAERIVPISECADCVLYPQCLRLLHCASKKFACTEITRTEQITHLQKAAENAYCQLMGEKNG